SAPRFSVSQKAFMSALRLAALAVDGEAARLVPVISLNLFFQKVQVDELMPPTVPVPSVWMIEARPPTWLVSAPSEYASTEKLFAAVLSALSLRALTRLIMRSLEPMFIRISRPDAVTCSAICAQSYLTVVSTSEAAVLSWS